MDHLEPREVLDWVIPFAMTMIAWYLRKLDATIVKVAEALASANTTVAVLCQRADTTDDRLEKLEEKHCN